MTETNIRADESNSKLEKMAQQEFTTSQKVVQAVRGYGAPILGAAAGYLVTGGVIGTAAGMALTSFLLDGNKNSPLIERGGYQVTGAIGVSTTIISALYSLFK